MMKGISVNGYLLGASVAPALLEKGGYGNFLFCLLVVQLYAFFCITSISQKHILEKEEYIIFQIVKGSVMYEKNCKEIY